MKSYGRLTALTSKGQFRGWVGWGWGGVGNNFCSFIGLFPKYKLSTEPLGERENSDAEVCLSLFLHAICLSMISTCPQHTAFCNGL